MDDLLVQAVERAWDDGITVVTAAGNLGPAPGSITAPGNSRKVITVGAGDLLEPRRGISGCGPTRDCVCKPDLVAPGKTSHFLRAWKKQEGICGEERHLDGGTAGVRSRGFGT